MPPVDEWASDANYPPGTSVGVSQATKVEPSSGAKAQGFIPGQKFAVQRLNWILNALCVLGNATEADLEALSDDLDAAVTALEAADTALAALIAAHSLQAAYDLSESLGQTGPHIDITGGYLRVGAPVPAIPLFLLNEADAEVFFGGDVEVLNTKTLKLGNVNKLLITGGGPSGVPHALIQTSGVGGQVALDSGLYTPTVSAVTGTGVSAGDFTNIAGNFIRVGKTFHFSLDFRVNTTGWGGGGSGTVSFTLPVAGTVDGYVRGTVSMVEPMDGKFTTLTLARSASPTVVQLLMIKDTTYDNYMSVSGTLTLQ